MPRFSNPPAVGGRGTGRETIDPCRGIRTLLLRAGLFAAALFVVALRLGTFSARGTFPVCAGLSMLRPTFPLCAGLSILRPAFPPPMLAPGEAVWNEPRLPAGGGTRLTTGPAKEGFCVTPPPPPPFGPTLAARVRRTSAQWLGLNPRSTG